MEEKFYTKKHLLVALKAADLPCSFPTLIRYEKTGKIPRPTKIICFSDRIWRIYTQIEIDEIILKVKSFKNKV